MNIYVVQLTIVIVAIALFAIGAAAAPERSGGFSNAGMMLLSVALAIELYLRFAI